MEQKTFCVYGCPNHPASEYEAKKLIRHLMDDLKSSEPQVKWQTDPEHPIKATYFSVDVLTEGDTVEIFLCGTRKNPALLLNYILNPQDFFTAVEYGTTGLLANVVELVDTVAHAVTTV